MARKFDVEWDDFSGGYYVGRSDARQPKNTWRGNDVMVAQHDQMLVPAAPIEIANNWAGTVLNSFGPILMDGIYLYAFDDLDPFLMWELPVLTDWDGVSPLNSYTFTTNTPTGRGVVAGGYLVMPTDAAFIATYNLSTNVTSTATAGPAIVTDMAQWGEFTMAWNGSTNRLYYSAPANPLSWSSANYYDIGKPGDRILTCAAALGTLYVGTEGAWYALTGVPGASISVRQITYTGASSAYSTPDLNGVVFAGGYNGHTPVAALAGSRLQPVIYDASSATTTADVHPADQYLVGDPGDVTGESLWVRAPEGSWSKLGAEVSRGFPADRSIYFESASRVYYIANGIVCRQKLDVHDPPLDAAGTSFQTCAAILSDYQANSPFRVDEVIVELSLGVTAANSPRRSVSCAVEQTSVPVEASSTTGFSTNTSDNQTYLMPGMAQATNNERVTVRFRPNNAGASYTAAPRITLEGVKLRRVIMRCTET